MALTNEQVAQFFREASLRSSPWIRTQPHLGFSLPRRTTEISDPRIERRTTGASSTVGPFASDELAVPPKQRLGCDHERGPSVPGEGTTRRREERPIAVLQFRAPNGPPENFHLMAENGVLELELGHAPPTCEHSDHADEHEVDEGSHGPRMLPTSAIRAEPSFGPSHAFGWKRYPRTPGPRSSRLRAITDVASDGKRRSVGDLLPIRVTALSVRGPPGDGLETMRPRKSLWRRSTQTVTPPAKWALRRLVWTSLPSRSDDEMRLPLIPSSSSPVHGGGSARMVGRVMGG